MGYNFTEFNDLNKWFEKLQSLPGFEENEAGAKYLADYMKSKVEDTLY
jgi:hypothetical protein